MSRVNVYIVPSAVPAIHRHPVVGSLGWHWVYGSDRTPQTLLTPRITVTLLDLGELNDCHYYD